PQIAAVERRLQVRKELVERYRVGFSDGPVRLVAPEPDTVSAEHMFLIHVAAVRDTAIDILNEAGIGVGVHYRSVPTATYYEESYGYTSSDHPISACWGAGTLTLPLYVSLTRAEQDHVIHTVRRSIYPLLENAQRS